MFTQPITLGRLREVVSVFIVVLLAQNLLPLFNTDSVVWFKIAAIGGASQPREKLDERLEKVERSALPELQSFAAGIERDKAAVQAGLTLPYSNGLLEGHVNRLKLIKRSMYGRAKFDLLRLRVLSTA